jgi:hypothetical protein
VTDKTETDNMDGCLATVALLLYPFVMLWHGYVYTTLWGWSVVPAFGWPQVTLPVTVAAVVLGRLLTMKNDYKDRPNVGRLAFTHMIGGAMLSGLGLFAAWLARVVAA